MFNEEIMITKYVFMDNGKDIAFVIDEQKYFNLRVCDAHIEGNDVILTPTEYSGKHQLKLKDLKTAWIDRLNILSKITIAECLPNKEFGDIVEIRLDK